MSNFESTRTSHPRGYNAHRPYEHRPSEGLTWVALHVGVARPRGVAAAAPVRPVTLPYTLGRQTAPALAAVSRACAGGREEVLVVLVVVVVLHARYNLPSKNTVFIYMEVVVVMSDI